MLNVALNERTMYNEFDLEKEILYFNVGTEGFVSLHAHNYNRKVQLSPSELKALLRREGYYALSSSCYINLSRIKAIIAGVIYFDTQHNEPKMLAVGKRTEHKLRQLIAL